MREDGGRNGWWTDPRALDTRTVGGDRASVDGPWDARAPGGHELHSADIGRARRRRSRPLYVPGRTAGSSPGVLRRPRAGRSGSRLGVPVDVDGASERPSVLVAGSAGTTVVLHRWCARRVAVHASVADRPGPCALLPT